MLRKLTRFALPAALVLIPVAATAQAQGHLTTPKEFLGFNFGDDYQLASYEKISAYWRKLATESNRMVVREMGKTAEGRTQLSVIVSSPENIQKLEHYRQIERSLALAESLTDEQAHTLAKEGKAVVWIDGGLHASEVLGAQQLAEMVWQMVSRTDEETMRILNDDIIVFVHANPDGNQLTADWYNRDSVPERRTNAPGLPRLYQKYIGHDDNRDFYGSTQAETKNMNRWMYHEWFPIIVYNHHQTGPEGTVMFSPPFRDPFNYYFDPLIVEELDLAAAAMHTRFEAEGKPGVTMRSGSLYSTWWNGGLRTTAYFHNMIGILTETIGNPTPMRIPYVPNQVLPRGDLPDPIQPQEWHFRQSIEYSITANRALLDLASRYRETLLYNIYRMGKNSIERGSRDAWTVTPTEVARANEAFAAAGGGGRGGRGGGRGGRGGAGGAAGPDPYTTVLHTPEGRDPRGYIIPSDQPDFLTAIKFVNALREVNVTINRATAAFTVNGKNYPAGSFVIFTAQAFRPHVLDMFEPQDHPNDFPYPGAPPTPPYDNAGWTLAYQMGVKFDRVLEGFSGPFVRVTDWNVPVPAGRVSAAARPAGYFTSHQVNDAFRAVAQLLAAREDVYWLQAPETVNGKTYPAGTLYVNAKGTTAALIAKIATETGVSFDATTSKPSGSALKLKQPRIGLMDVYGGSMPSGWTRWLLEQFGIPFDRTFPPRVDLGNLNAKYDVLILPSGIVPNPWGGGRRGGGGGGGDQAPGAGGGAGNADSSAEASLPAEYRNQRGRVTPDKTIAAIKTFVENGGTVIAYGSSSSGVAAALGLPVSSHLTEGGAPLPNTKFYIPGSVMRATVDTTLPISAGMSGLTDVFFESDPVFDLAPDAAAKGVKRIAWYDGKATLRSGWAWGQEYLDGGTAAIQATIGKGTAYLFGPEILQRAQPHGTFKFLFNGLYLGTATPGRP